MKIQKDVIEMIEPHSMELVSVKLRSIELRSVKLHSVKLQSVEQHSVKQRSVKLRSMELHSVEDRVMELHSNSNLKPRNTVSSQKKMVKKVLWKRTFGFSLELCRSAPDFPIYNYPHFFSNFSLKHFITSNVCDFIIYFFQLQCLYCRYFLRPKCPRKLF